MIQWLALGGFVALVLGYVAVRVYFEERQK